MKALVAVLPGDGVGPEVTRSAVTVLQEAAEIGHHQFEFVEGLIGGVALDATGSPLPAETLELCARADAILLGAVGGPKWSDPEAALRPEQGLLDLRRRFELFANLRPVHVFSALKGYAPLREELLAGVDLLFVRELTGGLYFGRRQEQGDGDSAFDTMEYSEAEVERIAHVAFRAARGRRRKVTSVDKANVLASMRLWRRTVTRVAAQYPDVVCEHQLVDSCAMHLMRTPAAFDVVLAGNLFGDILSDEAAVLTGSLGLLPSASLGSGSLGLYEPVHGSAPDIAGLGVANPVGAILSAAMLLRHSLKLEDLALMVEAAVSKALAEGHRTADLIRGAERPATTEEMTAAVLELLGWGVWMTV
jgi:3-isopropylmalate dehydrogenase